MQTISKFFGRVSLVLALAFVVGSFLLVPASASAAACFLDNDIDLKVGMTSPDIQDLQRVLNSDPSTRVAASGAGSPGNETTYFGTATESAVKSFQSKYSIQVSGIVGNLTRSKLSMLYSCITNGAVRIGSGSATIVQTGAPYPVSIVLADPQYAGRLVDITVKKVGATIASFPKVMSLQSNNIFNWSVPANDAGSFSIVVSYNGQTLGASALLIVQGGIVVTAPASCQAGSVCRINWNTTHSGLFDISIRKGATNVFTSLDTSSGNSFDWQVPATAAVGNDYQVSVQASEDPVFHGGSPLFSVTAAPAQPAQSSISIATPVAGASCQIGVSCVISWTGTSLSKINLWYSSGNAWVLIGSGNPTSATSGFYSWAVPNTLAVGGTYILVQNENAPGDTVSRISPILSIVAAPVAQKTITVTTPSVPVTGGHTIQWTTSPAPIASGVDVRILKGGVPIKTANTTAAGLQYGGAGDPRYDYNNDGMIDIADGNFLTQVALGNQSCPAGKLCDLDGNGVNVSDSVTLTNYILNLPPPPGNPAYDYDNNGGVDGKDVNYLKDVSLGNKSCPAGKTCDINGNGGVTVDDVLTLTNYVLQLSNVALQDTGSLWWGGVLNGYPVYGNDYQFQVWSPADPTISGTSGMFTIGEPPASATIVSAQLLGPLQLEIGNSTYIAKVTNTTNRVLSNVVISAWIEQGAVKSNESGALIRCFGQVVGTLPLGDCTTDSSVPPVVPLDPRTSISLRVGPATMVVELSTGTTIFATKTIPVQIVPWPALTITAPVAADVVNGWLIGHTSKHKIAWKSVGPVSANVNITLRKNNVKVGNIVAPAGNQDGANTYQWTLDQDMFKVENGFAPGAGYTIHIEDVAQGAIYADSIPFSILEEPLNMTIDSVDIAPTDRILTIDRSVVHYDATLTNKGVRTVSGVTLSAHVEQSVASNIVRGELSSIPIQCLGVLPGVAQSGQCVSSEEGQLVSAISTSGALQPGPAQAVVELKQGNTLIARKTVAVTLIPAPGITIQVPNGDESWEMGAKHTIKWTTIGRVGDVTIRLKQVASGPDGVMHEGIIKSNITNPGSSNYSLLTPNKFDWYARESFVVPGENYKVEIFDSANNEISDETNGVFSITVPSPTFISPKAGSSYFIDDTFRFSIDATHPLGLTRYRVKLYQDDPQTGVRTMLYESDPAQLDNMALTVNVDLRRKSDGKSVVELMHEGGLTISLEGQLDNGVFTGAAIRTVQVKFDRSAPIIDLPRDRQEINLGSKPINIVAHHPANPRTYNVTLFQNNILRYAENGVFASGNTLNMFITRDTKYAGRYVLENLEKGEVLLTVQGVLIDGTTDEARRIFKVIPVPPNYDLNDDKRLDNKDLAILQSTIVYDAALRKAVDENRDVPDKPTLAAPCIDPSYARPKNCNFFVDFVTTIGKKSFGMPVIDSRDAAMLVAQPGYNAGSLAPSLASYGAPTVISPTPGTSWPVGQPGDVVIQPVPGASGYLVGFIRGNTMIFENYRDNSGDLSTVPEGGNEIYRVPSGFTDRFTAGPLNIYVRALINNQWTEAAVVPITIGGAPSIPVQGVTPTAGTFIITPGAGTTWSKSAAQQVVLKEYPGLTYNISFMKFDQVVNVIVNVVLPRVIYSESVAASSLSGAGTGRLVYNVPMGNIPLGPITLFVSATLNGQVTADARQLYIGQ